MLRQAGKFWQLFFFFCVGGFAYISIETLFRGYSHFSMFVAGGLCFLFMGQIKKEYAIVTRMLIAVAIITGIELVTGIIVNRIMGLSVWDYSLQQYNVYGQICLLFSNLWFVLSLPAIISYDYLQYYLVGGEKPSYHL